jgi:hypothetical protein
MAHARKAAVTSVMPHYVAVKDNPRAGIVHQDRSGR